MPGKTHQASSPRARSVPAEGLSIVPCGGVHLWRCERACHTCEHLRQVERVLYPPQATDQQEDAMLLRTAAAHTCKGRVDVARRCVVCMCVL